MSLLQFCCRGIWCLLLVLFVNGLSAKDNTVRVTATLLPTLSVIVFDDTGQVANITSEVMLYAVEQEDIFQQLLFQPDLTRQLYTSQHFAETRAEASTISFAPRRERGKPAVVEQREASVIREPMARELATDDEVTGTSVA